MRDVYASVRSTQLFILPTAMQRPHTLNRLHRRLSRARGRYTAVEADGIPYVVDTLDDGPGGALLLVGGTPELEVLPLALRILAEHGVRESRDWFIDVGANIGTTVVPALTRNGFARAIAIEPEPDNLRVLRANLALNDLHERVDVVAAAATDKAGTATFRRGKRTTRGWRAGAGSLADRPSSSVMATVDTVALDPLLHEKGIAPAEIGLLWLDVQGHEGHALKGAANLLRALPPIVFASRPRKLAKASGTQLLEDALGAYSWLVDLRPPHGEPARLTPRADLHRILARQQVTDVLAFA